MTMLGLNCWTRAIAHFFHVVHWVLGVDVSGFQNGTMGSRHWSFERNNKLYPFAWATSATAGDHISACESPISTIRLVVAAAL